MKEALPVIDISDLPAKGSSEYRRIAAQLDGICCRTGFFYIRDATIRTSQIDEVWRQTRSFFALPAEEKSRIAITQSAHHRGYGPLGEEALEAGSPGDLKETFNMGLDLPLEHPRVQAGMPLYGPNLYPSSPMGFQATMEGYYEAMSTIARKLMRLLAVALGLEPNFFNHCLDEPLCTLRLIHYPPGSERKDPRQSGCGAHTDYGCITLLAQDDIGGLEVLSRDRQWIAVPPIPGTLVVNIGDLMARWTNDRWVSTAHRVKSPGTDQHRYSIPFFVDPAFETEVRCLASCQSTEDPPKYSAITCGEWILSRFDATYEYRK